MNHLKTDNHLRRISELKKSVSTIEYDLKQIDNEEVLSSRRRLLDKYVEQIKTLEKEMQQFPVDEFSEEEIWDDINA